jgi:hypothetical protein
LKFFKRFYVLATVCCTLALTALNGCTSQGTLPAQNAGSTHTNSTSTNDSTGNGNTTSANHAVSVQTKPSPPPVIQLGGHTALASYLNETLGLLGYLPLQFHPAHGVTTAVAMKQMSASTQPLPGSYVWKDSGSDMNLQQLWNPLLFNTITQGALMRFKEDHRLQIDGVAGPNVWKAIQAALGHQQLSVHPYTFITVDELPTEVLKVWVNGRVTIQTPANTGIAQSPTSIGTWPIYLRYVSQEMKGTTPWGSTYDDPGVPYVSYFHGGDAVHGFPRASYGSPQSLGCVEIPISISKSVFNAVDYGVLVSVRK